MSCILAYSAVKAHFVGVVVNDVAGLVNTVGLQVKHNKYYRDCLMRGIGLLMTCTYS